MFCKCMIGWSGWHESTVDNISSVKVNENRKVQRLCLLDSALAHWAKPGIIFLSQTRLGACSVQPSAVKQYKLAQIDKLICSSFECGALHKSQLWEVPTFFTYSNTDNHSHVEKKKQKTKLLCLFWRPDDNNHSFEGQGVNLDAMRGDPNS